MVEGRILKGIGGFYYVLVGETLYECKARGIFKVQGKSPMVGDRVMITIQDENPPLGVIEDILERQVVLHRPLVANVDQAIIVFAVRHPEIHPVLLDKLLILCAHAGIKPLICFNKSDLEVSPSIRELEGIYEAAGYDILLTSAQIPMGLSEMSDVLKDRVTVFAGPSGVGKSSLLNVLEPGLTLQTGAISDKIKRGKHTTRHSELIPLKNGGWVVDTPGFTSLDLEGVEARDLAGYYLDFVPYIPQCRFSDCSHINEPGCAVLAQVGKAIHTRRYDSYKTIFFQIQEQRRNQPW